MQCGLPLKHTWSVSDLWGQGPFIILWLTLHFTLAFWADLCRSGVKVNLCGFWLLQPSPPPFLGLCVGKYGFRWAFYTEFLQCDSASWWLHAEVVPICRVAMDTSGRPWENEGGRVLQKNFFQPFAWIRHWIPPCYEWGPQAPVQPLRNQFPSSSLLVMSLTDKCINVFAKVQNNLQKCTFFGASEQI